MLSNAFFLFWRPYMGKVLEITVITQFLFAYYILVGSFSLFCIIWLLFTVQSPTHSACSHCSRPFVHLSAQLKNAYKITCHFKIWILYEIQQLNHHGLWGFPQRVISCYLWTLQNPKLLLLKEHNAVKPTHLLVFNYVQSQALSLCTSFGKYGFKLCLKNFRNTEFKEITHFFWVRLKHFTRRSFREPGWFYFLETQFKWQQQWWKSQTIFKFRKLEKHKFGGKKRHKDKGTKGEGQVTKFILSTLCIINVSSCSLSSGPSLLNIYLEPHNSHLNGTFKTATSKWCGQ